MYSNNLDFQTQEEISYFLVQKKIFPLAYSLSDSFELIKKQDAISYVDMELLKINSCGKYIYKQNEVKTKAELSLSLKAGFNAKDIKGIDFSLDYNYDSSYNEESYNKVISYLFQKLEVSLPTEAIHIKPEIEKNILNIMKLNISNVRKYIELIDYFKENGRIIPTSVIIGDSFNYFIQSDSLKDLEKYELNFKLRQGK